MPAAAGPARARSCVRIRSAPHMLSHAFTSQQPQAMLNVAALPGAPQRAIIWLERQWCPSFDSLQFGRHKAHNKEHSTSAAMPFSYVRMLRAADVQQRRLLSGRLHSGRVRSRAAHVRDEQRLEQLLQQVVVTQQPQRVLIGQH